MLVALAAFITPKSVVAADQKPVKKYFAHAVVEDQYGVVAPWYGGQNGQCDFRIRVAAETLNRYPWAEGLPGVKPAPHFVFNGHWSISHDGTISIDPKLNDWDNGDIGQRSVSLLYGMTNYYRYSGDPAAIGLVTLVADNLLDNCQTPADHAWPRFPISCPTHGKAYAQANPHGFIQLDLSAQLGSGVLLAYKLTGDVRYLKAAKHWADLLAEHCDRRPSVPPWNRYANPKDVPWNSRQTGGVALVLQFFDDMIRTGYEGKDHSLVSAREAGEKYLRDVLLPEWTLDPTFGRNFWDWENATDTCAVPTYAAEYMMGRREAFPNWKRNVRNILSLYLCRSSVDPGSGGGVFSGAWAVPESSSCCGRSLQYPTMIMAASFAHLGALADSAWAREIARRQALLSSYDVQENGVVEDNIDGGTIVAGAWFNLAHPWPMRMMLELLAWQPAELGANRENHIMRTNSVVSSVQYSKGRIAYTTFDAAAPCEDVLRLAFCPQSVAADGNSLKKRDDLSQSGFNCRPLSNGDFLVAVRHDGSKNIVISGPDPEDSVRADRLQYVGDWSEIGKPMTGRFASRSGAKMDCAFNGNQVRLIGDVAADGGKADVYLDGVKQLCGIDFWCPQSRQRQVVFYRNGLKQVEHRLEIVAIGTKNPRSLGTKVSIDGVQTSAAQGEADFGAGQGPGGEQRVVFGYVGRKDYVDSHGDTWRPATEFTLRLKTLADLVPIAFWTTPQIKEVAGTSEAELYRYGLHGRDFTAYFTVAPAQTYHVRLKFCQARAGKKAGEYATNIDVVGKPVARDFDIAAEAGGIGRALDLGVNGVRPENGLIEIHLWNSHQGEALIQAIEIGPGPNRPGTKEVEFK